jgi:uncharacterized repeat protein (TIGR03833 family)
LSLALLKKQESLILIYVNLSDEHESEETIMNGQQRKNIKPGMEVAIVLKQDQRTGKLTKGVVKDLLTKSQTHPHGIKVRLIDGQVGRVKEIISDSDNQ